MNRNFAISILSLFNQNRNWEMPFRFWFAGKGIPVPFRIPAGHFCSGPNPWAGILTHTPCFLFFLAAFVVFTVN
jgi:hypothetical protein